MAAIADIQTALLARSATITDALQRAECEAAIAEYIALRTAILALSSSQITSYSLGGRSVTRADLASLRQQAQAARAEIVDAMDGGEILIADLRQPQVYI
jgi:hypothetical protein